MAFYQFSVEQHVDATQKEVWEFISSPANLKKITPKEMGFDITSKDEKTKMYPGMIITYKVSPLMGIKMNWMTEITQVKEMDYFIDEQRVGPYKMWHHQHKLISDKKGVKMIDLITYIPPFGFIGAIANKLIIENKLKEIFVYRTIAVNKEFNIIDSKS
jgi:ligand-binding SRPBCC domain-containing protein|tara:strand:- start:3010 stop:3486 length:477 start_codon:yes stop_codon:yes gene_type:complete